MRLQLIRSATLILEYAGHRVLIDPDFAYKHARESLAGHLLNPVVNLPLTVSQIFEDVGLVIVTHLHRDSCRTSGRPRRRGSSGARNPCSVV